MDETAYTERLRSELASLAEASVEGRDQRDPVALDQQSVGRLSRMDAMQVQAMAQATERRRQTRMRAVQAALDRLESGDFGYCLRCGEEIAPKRLQADPTNTLCIACADRSD